MVDLENDMQGAGMRQTRFILYNSTMSAARTAIHVVSTSAPVLDRRVSVAPMMGYTDRYCRYFMRLLSPSALLYTEMVTSQALLHGDPRRFLEFDAAENPVALQLGGSEPEDLAVAARLGAEFGYREINLNCGCPSERVRKGSFGACLMDHPALVADCVRAMRASVSPVSYTHLARSTSELTSSGCNFKA